MEEPTRPTRKTAARIAALALLVGGGAAVVVPTVSAAPSDAAVAKTKVAVNGSVTIKGKLVGTVSVSGAKLGLGGAVDAGIKLGLSTKIVNNTNVKINVYATGCETIKLAPGASADVQGKIGGSLKLKLA